MKRELLVLLAALAALLLAAGQSSANPTWAGECGIPAQQTVWGDYSWPSLLPIMARPGTLVAVSDQQNTDYAAQARALGANTYAFDLKLKQKVGTPSAPADPSTIEAAAEAEYQKAVARSGGCTTPMLVENELSGAANVTPWSDANAQYRANVLAFLEDLATLGAHPVLLVPVRPYLGSNDAVAWWLQVAQVADVVREDYLPAPLVWKLGPIRGNRFVRQRYRAAVQDFSSIGIPTNRLGIMISFLSQKGIGGRDGLEPSSAWFQVVKWFGLSAKQVASELRLGSIFSWGWQQWNPKEVDPDKPDAACVWLWSRQQSLCDAPHRLGRGFDTSRSAGQLSSLGGEYCSAGGLGAFGPGEVTRLTAVTGDRNAALGALFERLVESHYGGAPRSQVLAAERAVVAQSFGGSRAAYIAALQQAHATVALGRAVLADEVRQARLAATFSVPRPSSAAIASFYSAYAGLPVRQVRATATAPWLGNAKVGWAISGVAPEPLFTAPAGRRTRVTTLLGPYTVKPLGQPQTLGALPIAAVRPAIVAALESFERAAAFQRWTIALQRNALNVALCRGDVMPDPAQVDLTTYLPFLRLR